MFRRCQDPSSATSMRSQPKLSVRSRAECPHGAPVLLFPGVGEQDGGPLFDRWQPAIEEPAPRRSKGSSRPRASLRVVVALCLLALCFVIVDSVEQYQTDAQAFQAKRTETDALAAQYRASIDELRRLSQDVEEELTAKERLERDREALRRSVLAAGEAR